MFSHEQTARHLSRNAVFHGTDRAIPAGEDMRPPKNRGGRGRYTTGDDAKVYGTTDESLAWDYAEDKSTRMLKFQQSQPWGEHLRPESPRGRVRDWTDDPESLAQRAVKTGNTPIPHVYSIEMRGNLDVDPNWASAGKPIEEQKAFRGDSAAVLSTQFAPPGAQLSWAPHPEHGGYYSKDAVPGAVPEKMPQQRPIMEVVDGGAEQMDLLAQEGRHSKAG